MTRAKMSNAHEMYRLLLQQQKAAFGRPIGVFNLSGTPKTKRLERDPSQSVGLPCPNGHRPAFRASRLDMADGYWLCSDKTCAHSSVINGAFTLADVLRYLWNRKS